MDVIGIYYGQRNRKELTDNLIIRYFTLRCYAAVSQNTNIGCSDFFGKFNVF